MENENQPPKDDAHLSDSEKKRLQEVYDDNALLQKIIHELKTEERFVNFFSNYLPSSVESFIKSYAHKKMLILKYGQFWLEQRERSELQWIELAEKHLQYIQQKKLFDLQCLWRAEKIKLDGVEITRDLTMWEADIFNCPYIDPVNEADIALYDQYLRQNNVELQAPLFFDWQDYDTIKEAYQSDGESKHMPEWYEFHNGRTGSSSYMLLPDIRGKKEHEYAILAYEHERPAMEARQAEYDKTRDKRPYLQGPYDKEFMKFFMSTFETKQVQAYYKARESEYAGEDNWEMMSSNIRLLLKAGRPIPIEAHHDFKEAIERAVERYRIGQVIEFLPAAFEAYLINLAMGTFPVDPKQKEHDEQNRNFWANKILKGRELCGEPRDFNF